MWEVMNAYMTMHNMIIESAQENPILDTKPYHHQGPPVTVDHQVPLHLLPFLPCIKKSEMQILIANSKTIS
jgi:hypothetical protein